MQISRRAWLSIAAANGLACVVPPYVAARQRRDEPARLNRITRIIEAYGKQGFHRTGTAVDRASGEWLCDEVRKAGLTPTREAFPFSRVDLVAASLAIGDRRLEGLPLFDGTFTDAAGIRGRLGALGSESEIGLAEVVTNAAAAGALGEARRQSRHKGIVCITRGGRPGLCPSNADFFLEPFGPPVLQVSSEHADMLQDAARQRLDVRLVAYATRTAATAFNVTASISGVDPALRPFVVMTPRSGWYWCASERGGGLVCWLEMMRALRERKPMRDVLFVASTGHELGHLGINAYVDRRQGIVKASAGWLHFGANIGAAVLPSATAAQPSGAIVQASDDELETMLADAMTSVSLSVGTRVPRGRVPSGEAEVVHRGGGRYVSAIGRNALFHHVEDRGPTVVNAEAIAAFVEAFSGVAAWLAGRDPVR